MSLKINKPIVLIGLMGAGKTSVGHRLAKRLELPFTDIDNKIESLEGRTVHRIFEEDGEEVFRKKENDIIKETLEKMPHVIATGGGAFINNKNRSLIKEKAITIWLKAPIDVLVERVSRKNTRPLLEKGNKQEIMKKLMEERYPVYEEADIVVESSPGPHYIVVDKILKKLEEYGR